MLFAISAIVLFPLFLDLSGGQWFSRASSNQNGDTYFDRSSPMGQEVADRVFRKDTSLLRLPDFDY